MLKTAIRRFWLTAITVRAVIKPSYKGALTLRVILVIRRLSWPRALWSRSAKPSYRGEIVEEQSWWSVTVSWGQRFESGFGLCEGYLTNWAWVSLSKMSAIFARGQNGGQWGWKFQNAPINTKSTPNYLSCCTESKMVLFVISLTFR